MIPSTMRLMRLMLLMLLFMALAMTPNVLLAQNTFDTRLLFIPIQQKENPANVQVSSFNRSMVLQLSMARSIFVPQSKQLSLSNFPLPGMDAATLVLERTHAVVDANTEFYTHTKAGKVAFKVGPVLSYRGTVNGDPETSVSLHYSDGDVTGFVRLADGQRTLIGRDFSAAVSEQGVPHVIADEVAMFGIDPLSNFVCGNESLPIDPDAAARKMVVPTVPKTVEGVQAEYLRLFKVAVVLREDIDSIMKQRNQTDEQIAQYFIKVAATTAQVYEQELNAYFYIGHFEKFTEEEPSGYFYDGRSPRELLNEFSLDWSSRMNKVDRTVAHLYTRARPAGGIVIGGVANLDGMCQKNNGGGYAVSTVYLNASQLPGDPNRSNGFVWDVFVTSHEIGHNIGAYHTHACYWSPPLDTCVIKSDGTDACYSDPSLRRVVPGTIMSYCHLFNGSTVPLTFGTRVAERMRSWVAAASCNPLTTVPTVQITEPRGSDAYSIGERVTIRWVSALVSTVNILWGPSQSGPWTAIVNGLNAAARQYTWTTTMLPVQTFWLRLEDASDPNVNDTTLASFLISVPVTLDAPKGGERLGVESAFNVRWTKTTGVGNVKLEFAADGSTYTTLLPSSSASSFAWTVPNTITEKARMRVTALSSLTAPSTSADFAIGVRRFALEIPEEDAFLCKNQVNQYRWSADFIPTIRIQYSTDAGTNWRTATQQSTIETLLWQVFSRNVNMNNVPAGTMLMLRVIDSETQEVLDTRNALRMDSCDAPVSVSESAIALPFSITSIFPNPATSSVRFGVSSTVPLMCDVLLISSDGSEIILRSGISIVPGATVHEIPLQGAAAGMYRIGLREGGSMVVAPLVIVR